MKIYTFHQIQKLPMTVEAAWDFFSAPGNLQKITPPYMGFEIISGGDRKMFPGQLIQYTVRPLFGLPMKWVTEITYADKPHYFVDEQRFGPYALWHHKHFIRAVEGGVEMEDIVDYKLPMGILGQWVHPFLVRPKLEQIFEFRRKKLIELFGAFKD